MNKRFYFFGIIAALLFSSAAAPAQQTQTNSDYPSARWVPLTCNKFYNSGNGRRFFVIHDMEGYYTSSISYLNRCDLKTDGSGDYAVEASVHYCVNGLKDSGGDSPAGEISQLVGEAKYAWHARCLNTWSVGTEHEGFVSNPAWYTDEMFIASAGLQRYLANKYGMAKDRNHIIGHNEWQNAAWVSWMSTNYPSIDPSCNDHTDPGVYWNWNYFMSLVLQTNVLTGRFWDLNGATAGAGATPNGTWDNTTTNWSSDANGVAPTGIWGTIDDAVFAAGADATNNYTVTVNGTQQVYSLRVLNANVTFTNGASGRLLFTGIGSYYSNYVAAGKTATFNVTFQGNGFPDKWGPGTAVYNNSASGTGYFSLNDGTIAVGNNSALATNKFVIGDTSGANAVTFKSANTSTRTLANRLVINANTLTFDAGGDLIFNGGVDLGSSGSTSPTMTVSNNTTFSGILSNTAGLTKTGSGTLTFNGVTANAYGGLTIVSGGILKLQKIAGLAAIPVAGVTLNSAGTLQLAAADQINDGAPLTLAGGLFQAAGFSEQLGTLKITANARLDFGAGNSVLRFAASSGTAWTAGTTLTVSNWNGSINGAGAEQLFFGANSSGLSAAQINQIKFVNPPGVIAGIYSAKILATGEVVPLITPPAIVTSPQSQNVVAGSNVTLSVTASGADPLAYQWRRGATNLLGATISSLQFLNISEAQAGMYSVVVTNLAGMATSSDAMISVYATAAATFNSLNADNGQFTFNIAGVPGYDYVIQTSTNMLDWEAIWTNASPFSFTATNQLEFPFQFYRAVYQP